MGLPSLSALGNKSSSNLKALPMSLGVVPHAVELTKCSVLAVETTATVPSGKCFVPSTHGVGKTRRYRLSLVKADRFIVAIATVKSEPADSAGLTLRAYIGWVFPAYVCSRMFEVLCHWKFTCAKVNPRIHYYAAFREWCRLVVFCVRQRPTTILYLMGMLPE